MITGLLTMDEGRDSHTVKICDQCHKHEGQHFMGIDDGEIYLCSDCFEGDHGLDDLPGVATCFECGKAFPENDGVAIGGEKGDGTAHLCPDCAAQQDPHA